MSLIDNYRRQHRSIVTAVEKLAATLDAKQLAVDSQAARTALGELAGVLKVHLSMEDKSLYPLLKASPHPATVQLATRFVESMGGLAATFSAYVEKYQRAEAIKSAPAQFIADTGGIAMALKDRISREEAELYVVAQREGL